MFDELFPILSTRDIKQALAFYRDLLGAIVTYQFPADGEPGYVGLRIGQSHFGIGQQEEPGESMNERITLWVYAADCDAGVQRLAAAGVSVLQEPTDQVWGERTAIVADPDGNRLIIGCRAVSGG
jgi:lactoylglutathione lyase